MVSFLVRWAVTALAVLVASYLFSGIRYESTVTILVVAFMLGIVNSFVKPVLFIVTLPFFFLSLGLITFLINGLILWGVAYYVDGFYIDGLWTAVKGAFMISLVSWVINMFVS